MFTPQQIEEHGFVKAVFGGYDMQSVDEFLDPLVEDYTTLYKENAVLKSKLRILVEKLEEYRKQEAAMQAAQQAAEQKAQQAIADAHQQAATMVVEAEHKASALLREAEQTAHRNAVSYQDEISTEERRLNQAKATATSFIDALEQDIQHHLDLLEKLKMMDLEPVVVQKPESVAAAAPAVPAAAPVQEQTDEIAQQIEQNLEKLVGSEPTPASTFDNTSTFDTKVMRPLHPESITAKFGDLQFGKNYNPNK